MPLPLLALGLAAGGAAAAGGGAALKIGNNTYRSSNFADTKHYDANRYNYGGSPTGAADAANRYRGIADQAQTRGGEQVNYGQANYDRQLGMAARNQQGQMAGLMEARARGLIPSIAQQQADIQMQQATAAQASAANSARGAGGLALAQQNAANNTATMQSAISSQAQVNAAQERMAAEQAAFGAYSGMRGQDLGSQAQTAQQAQYQAQLNAQQRAQNDQMTMGMTQNEMGVNNAQLNANTQQQAILAGQHAGAQQTNAGINQQNANRQMDWVKLGLGATQGGAEMGSAMGKRAEGGPIAPGQRYLVGEKGPEMVLPLYDQPQGKMLQIGADNRGFYMDEPSADDDRPSLAGHQGLMAEPPPIAARTPVKLNAPHRAERPMTDEEMLRAVAALEGQMRGEHEMRMSSGPAVRARAHGGPVASGNPYLVGENGPEMIVPSEAGMVIPNGLFSDSMTSGSGPGRASMDRLNGNGSMNVLGSLKAHSNFATQYQRDPTGGMRGGLF